MHTQKLQTITVMDIVTRLKYFMDFLKIGNSQFADNCRIPRPTLSQLLNGRNKKISDELIAKIHTAYPQLSVLWLMFGEGSMTVNGNTQFSEGQNQENKPYSLALDDDFQEDSAAVGAETKGKNEGSNNLFESFSAIGSKKSAQNGDDAQKLSLSLDPQQLSQINPNSAKKISSIVVFYTDNSFQSFSPTE